MNDKRYVTALTIAGSDSSGGAGIQADLKTFSALNTYGMSVLTALTAQNTQGVQAVFPITPRFVEAQLKSIFDDIKVDAIKMGMLHQCDIVEVVATHLPQYVPLVLDPVMVSKSGALLLEKDAIEAIRALLFPHVNLITPNLEEAEVFVGYPIRDEKTMMSAAEDLSNMGAKAVLLKGGHLPQENITDCLYLHCTKKFYWFPKTKINTRNTHGTGCTLSSAITAFLAKKNNLVEAVTLAEDYLYHAIAAGKELELGLGQGPVHHFYDQWK